MEVTLSKWGNSLGLRIPKTLAAQAGFAVGDVLDLVATPEGIVVKKACKRPRYDLEALLAGVRDDNRHGAIDLDGPQGRELL